MLKFELIQKSNLLLQDFKVKTSGHVEQVLPGRRVSDVVGAVAKAGHDLVDAAAIDGGLLFRQRRGHLLVNRFRLRRNKID